MKSSCVQGQISLENMEFANRYFNRRAETKHDFTGESGDIIATDTLSGVEVGFKPPDSRNRKILSH